MAVTVEKNLIPGIRRRLPELLDQVVRKAAFDIEAQAKQAAPVDTGALRASIHAVTDKSNGYAQAAAAVTAANPAAKVFPEVTLDGPHEAVVPVAAEYGVYVEMGTVRKAGRPFLTPAVEAVRKVLPAAVAAAIKKATEE